VIEGLRGRYQTIETIDTLPADLEAYYAQTLTSDRDTHPKRWYRKTLPLLAALAVAAERCPATG
jgi:hypothetical protein